MKAILIKERFDFYGLKVDGKIIATNDVEVNKTLNYPHTLSLKNCKAIERNYDLDELVDIRAEILNSYTSGTKLVSDIDKLLTRYREICEHLGDKKFSEKDLDNFRKFQIQEQNFSKSCLDVWLKSLQQTEWDVIVEMRPDSLVYKTDKMLPKPDADGCLIIKRI